MTPLATYEHWLPIVFAGLMGLAVLIYVILDGYDLGVGILLKNATKTEKDKMVASIGPFWDANETWLVLSVGLLLVAFPVAHGQILTALYLPTAIMLIALILRGVSFDFRSKVKPSQKPLWDNLFFIGSLGTAITQGYMLGIYIMGFESRPAVYAFALLVGICVAAGYSLIGAGWLIMKTEKQLQKKAVTWAQKSLWLTALGIVAISAATPAVSNHIFAKWFTTPTVYFLAIVPILTGLLILLTAGLLKRLPLKQDRFCWVPFVATVVVFILCFFGLAYSFYPYIIPGSMTVYDASTSLQSLRLILIGALIVLPCIIGYTIFAYRVFWGKVRDLRYD